MHLNVQPHSGGLTDISGVPTTIDLGGSSAWGMDHPPNKNEMSRRLALQTVHAAYAVQGRIPRAWESGADSLWTGPLLKSASADFSSADDHVVKLDFEDWSSLALKLRDVHGNNIDKYAYLI